MRVDWVTVLAQIVNFLVLVWLLARFLYGPIVRAMKRREAEVAARLAEAEAKGRAAERAARRHEEALEALEAARTRLMDEARAAAERLGRQLEADLRREVEETRARWRAQLEEERAAFLQEFRRQAARHFLEMARRALAHLADAALEEQMASVFAEQVRRLPAETADAVAAEARAAGGPVRVRSAFPLPASARRTITAAVHETLGGGLEIAYETTDQVTCGIEAIAGGRTLTWSIDGYLDDLEQRLAGLLAEPPAEAEAVRLT
ncbi:MAG TPA: F0F1 ATP synthase subunit B [Thermodesulfobacteriota bacterium]